MAEQNPEHPPEQTSQQSAAEPAAPGPGVGSGLLVEPETGAFPGAGAHSWDDAGFETRAIHAGQDPDPRTGAVVVDTREDLLDTTDDVERSSLDPYATYRSAYRQRRRAEIENRTGPVTPSCFGTGLGVGAGTGVHLDLPGPGNYLAGVPCMPEQLAKRVAISIPEVPELRKRLKAVERRLGIDDEPKRAAG